VDPEIRQRTLGHATAGMTSHYTRPEAAAYRQAAEDVEAYVEGRDHERMFPARFPRESSRGPSQSAQGLPGDVPASQRRAWDSNPRGSSRPLAVFKTAAIGH
jgi:hypothetical protein